MALGSSFVTGFSAGSEARSKEAAIRDKQTEAYNKVIGNVVKSAAEVAKSYTTGEHAAAPEEYAKTINGMIDSVIKSSQLAISSGYNVTPPEVLEGYRQTLLRAATPRQMAETKGTATAAGLVSEAQGVSTGGGIPLPEAQEARGLRPKGPATKIDIYTGEKIAGAGEKKATEKFGTGVGERADKRLTEAFGAKRMNNQLDRVALAISRGATTGLGQETILDIRNLAQTLGVQAGPEVKEQELIRTISNEMALRLRNPESGLGLTGNTSNKDLQFLKDSVVGLGRTPQGNVLIVEMLKKFNDIKVGLADEQARIVEKNGGVVPLNLDKQLMEYLNKVDFLSPTERKEIEMLAKQSGGSFYGLSPAGSSAFEKYRPKR